MQGSANNSTPFPYLKKIQIFLYLPYRFEAYYPSQGKLENNIVISMIGWFMFLTFGRQHLAEYFILHFHSVKSNFI